MRQAGFLLSKKTCIAIVCALLFSGAAQAATEGDGCNPAVWRAMTAKAQAKVAYDVAATEQIIKKPDSVLALTCFNNGAGISAAKGGSIFSGDFTQQLAPIIEDALQGFYSNFTDSVGALGGVVDYSAAATKLGVNPDCTKIKDLWDKVAQAGTEKGAPPMTFKELTNNIVPSTAGPEFAQNMQADAATMAELKNAVAAIPAPQNSFTAYTDGLTDCEYLQQNGIVSNCN